MAKNNQRDWDPKSPAVTAADPVTGLTAGTLTATTVPLSWTNPVGTEEVILRGILGPTAPAGVGAGSGFTVTPKDASSTVATGLTANTQYSFSVFSKSVNGETSGPTSITVTTPAA